MILYFTLALLQMFDDVFTATASFCEAYLIKYRCSFIITVSFKNFLKRDNYR